MIIQLIEPNGSVKATFPLAEIKHVETRTLEYFGESTYNLYLFIGEGKDEYFMLLTYICPVNMERAERELQNLIKQASADSSVAKDAVYELHPDAAPAIDLTTDTARPMVGGDIGI